MIAKELYGNFRSQLISAVGVVGTMFLVMIYGIFTPYFLDIFLLGVFIISTYFIPKYYLANASSFPGNKSYEGTE